MSKRERADDTYTLSPGESSVYSFSMVFDDPPAPAERDELGFETCDVPARRLQRKKKQVREKNEGFGGYGIWFRKGHAYRIWAPGGLATADAEERGEAERAGASESD